MEPPKEARGQEIERSQGNSLSSFDSIILDRAEILPAHSWIYLGVESHFRQLQDTLRVGEYRCLENINVCLKKRDITLLQLQKEMAQVLSSSSFSTLNKIKHTFFKCYQPSSQAIQTHQKNICDLTSVEDTFNLAIGLKQLKELSSCQANIEQKLQIVYELIPPTHYVSALACFDEKLQVIFQLCIHLAQMAPQDKQAQITALINEIKKQNNGDVLNEQEAKLFIEVGEVLVKNHYFEVAAQLAFKLSEERQEESFDILLNICKKLLQAYPRELSRLYEMLGNVFYSPLDMGKKTLDRDAFLERLCKQVIFEWRTLKIDPHRIINLANLITNEELKKKTGDYIKEYCPEAFASVGESMLSTCGDSGKKLEQAQKNILKHAIDGREDLIRNELNRLSEIANKQDLTVGACRILIEKGNHTAAILIVDFILNESVKQETVHYICDTLSGFVGNEDLIIQFVNTLRSATQKTTILTNACKIHANKRAFDVLGKLVQAIPEWSRLEAIKYICQQFVEAGNAQQIGYWCDNLPLKQKKLEIVHFCKALAEHHQYEAAFQLFYALPSEIEAKLKLDLLKYLCSICYVNHEFDLIIKKLENLETDLQQEILCSLPRNLARYLIIDQALESVKSIQDKVERVNISFYICSKIIENPRIVALANLVKNIDETYQFDFFKGTLEKLITSNPKSENLIDAGHLVQMVSIKKLQVYAIELLCVKWVKINCEDYLDKISALFTRVDEADQKAILENVYRELSSNVKYQQQSAEIKTFFENLQNAMVESEKAVSKESTPSVELIIALCHLFARNGDVQRIKEQINLLGEQSKPFYIEKFCKTLADAGYQTEAFRLLSSYPEFLESDGYLKTIQYLFDNCIKCRQVEKVLEEFANLRPEEKEALLPNLAMMFARSLYLAEATNMVLQIKDKTVQFPIIKFICQKHAYRFEIREIEALMEYWSTESNCYELVQEVSKILVTFELTDEARSRLQEATTALRLVKYPDLKVKLIQSICEQWAKIDDFVNLDKIKELIDLIEDEKKQGEVLSAVCIKLANEPLFEKRALIAAKALFSPPLKEAIIKKICIQFCLQGNFAKAKKEMAPFISNSWLKKEAFLGTIQEAISRTGSPYCIQAAQFICEECIHASKIYKIKDLTSKLLEGRETEKIEMTVDLAKAFEQHPFFQANLSQVIYGINQMHLKDFCLHLALKSKSLTLGDPKKHIFLLEKWIKFLSLTQDCSTIMYIVKREFKPVDFNKLNAHALEVAYQEANQLSSPEFRSKAIEHVIEGWIRSAHPQCWETIKEIVDEIKGSDTILKNVCDNLDKLHWTFPDSGRLVHNIWSLSKWISCPSTKGEVQRTCCLRLNTEEGFQLHKSLSNEVDKAYVLTHLICRSSPDPLSIIRLKEILQIVRSFREEKNTHEVMGPLIMNKDVSLLDDAFEIVKEFSSPNYKNNLLYSLCRRWVDLNMNKAEFEGKIKEVFAHVQDKQQQQNLLSLLLENLVKKSNCADAEIQGVAIVLKKIIADIQHAQMLGEVPRDRDVEVDHNFQKLYLKVPASLHVHIQKLEQDFIKGALFNASLLNAAVQEIQVIIFNSLLEELKKIANLVVEDEQLKNEVWSRLCQDWNYKFYLKGTSITWDQV